MPLDKSPRHKAPIYIACNKCDYVLDFRVVTHIHTYTYMYRKKYKNIFFMLHMINFILYLCSIYYGLLLFGVFLGICFRISPIFCAKN